MKLILGLWSLVAACLVAFCLGPSLADAMPPTPPHLILIVPDDISWSAWNHMGNPHNLQTPNVDALAAAGTVYEHGMSPDSVCLPALQTLLYGQHPRDVEAMRSYLPGPPPPNRQVIYRTTLPDRLRAASGYVSFQGGKHWEGTAMEAGFDEGTVDSLTPTLGHPSFWTFGRPSIQPLWDFLDTGAGADPDGPGPLERPPVFLWFAPMLPHTPIDPPPEFVELYEGQGFSEDAVQWFAQITRFDALVGELIAGLAARGLDPSNSVVAVLADNGWEQDHNVNHPIGSILGGPEGKLSIQEEGFRTPVILAGPGFPAIRYGAPHLVTFEEVWATLLEIGGASNPWGSTSLVSGPPMEEVRAYGEHDYVRLEQWPGWRGAGSASFVRTTQWRLTRRSDRPTMLHDITLDPFTEEDVIDCYPATAAALEADLDAWIEATPVPEPNPCLLIVAGGMMLAALRRIR